MCYLGIMVHEEKISATYQARQVHVEDIFQDTILTKMLENAQSSSMVDAAAMPTTLRLRGHAIKNVSTKKKGKNRL